MLFSGGNGLVAGYRGAIFSLYLAAGDMC